MGGWGVFGIFGKNSLDLLYIFCFCLGVMCYGKTTKHQLVLSKKIERALCT